MFTKKDEVERYIKDHNKIFDNVTMKGAGEYLEMRMKEKPDRVNELIDIYCWYVELLENRNSSVERVALELRFL